MTTEAATKRGLVPAAPIARVIQDWVARQKMDNPLEVLSFETGFPLDYFRKLGKYVTFDRADRIVVTIDPFLWMNDHELRSIYQAFDFTWLDERKPTFAA